MMTTKRDADNSRNQTSSPRSGANEQKPTQQSPTNSQSTRDARASERSSGNERSGSNEPQVKSGQKSRDNS